MNTEDKLKKIEDYLAELKKRTNELDKIAASKADRSVVNDAASRGLELCRWVYKLKEILYPPPIRTCGEEILGSPTLVAELDGLSLAYMNAELEKIMTGKWALWLDDLRNPHSSEKRNLHPIHHKYIWARDVEQAVYFVKLLGIPEYMALDHDLGLDEDETRSKNSIVYKETGMKFLMWLEEYMKNSTPPKWKVHSDNPAGAKNMESFMKSWEKAANQGIYTPDEPYFEYKTNPGRVHDIFKTEHMGEFIKQMTKGEARERILNIVKHGSQSPRSIEVAFDEIDQKLARVTLVEMMDSGEVRLNNTLKVEITPKSYKSLEMVRDHAVANLVKAEKPASHQTALCRQVILDRAKELPQTAKQIREALILKGWSADQVRREIAWLWDNGFINVDLNQSIVWIKDFFQEKK